MKSTILQQKAKVSEELRLLASELENLRICKFQAQCHLANVTGLLFSLAHVPAVYAAEPELKSFASSVKLAREIFVQLKVVDLQSDGHILSEKLNSLLP